MTKSNDKKKKKKQKKSEGAETFTREDFLEALDAVIEAKKSKKKKKPGKKSPDAGKKKTSE